MPQHHMTHLVFHNVPPVHHLYLDDLILEATAHHIAKRDVLNTMMTRAVLSLGQAIA